MTSRVLVRTSEDDALRRLGDDEELPPAEAGRLVWVDLVSEDAGEIGALGEQFSFDPAAVEDILDIEHLPKFDDFDDHLFIVLHALTTDGDRLDTIEVDCFVRSDLLVTVRRGAVPSVDWLWNVGQRHSHLSEGGGDELFTQLAEVIGRRYLEVIDEFERRIDDLADRALEADPGVLAEIQLLRREEATVRKILRPQRLVLTNLRRSTVPVMSESARRQLTDAYDVHNQVVESLAGARGLLNDALDSYRGASAERQSRATTLLAVYSAILLPLTVITGWYGMNVTTLPGATGGWAWEIIAGAMVLFGILSFAVFVRLGFVRAPRLGRRRVVRGLADAARAPIAPLAMLWRPRRAGDS
ncbi:MAG: magnesium transporter CorA family protein [Acidimicrobiales bacterium]